MKDGCHCPGCDEYRKTCPAAKRLDKFIINNKYFRQILNICKYCKYFTVIKKEKTYRRYQCDKKQSTIDEAYWCKKTDDLRGELEQSI
ncbi:MAG: hypothetical protein FWC06_08710 [Treponema sp.]|nr:hypothetical protein [Treponema sp.]